MYSGAGISKGEKLGLLIPMNQQRLMQLVRKGRNRWLHMAPPCKTFSRARRGDSWGTARVLRAPEQPEGVFPNHLDTWQGNVLAKLCARLARAQHMGWWSVFHRQPRGEPDV